jgi:hypothetical protein
MAKRVLQRNLSMTPSQPSCILDILIHKSEIHTEIKFCFKLCEYRPLQVYYHMRRLGNPDALKSPDLYRHHRCVRHGSFSAFSVLLWVRADLTADRMLLAAIVTLYMYARWRPNRENYRYQSTKWAEKKVQLSTMS